MGIVKPTPDGQAGDNEKTPLLSSGIGDGSSDSVTDDQEEALFDKNGGSFPAGWDRRYQQTRDDSISEVKLLGTEKGTGIGNDDLQQLRSIDEFLDNAYRRGRAVPLRYFLVILSLAVANSSFSTNILLVSYLLADDSFKRTVLLQDDTTTSRWRGGLLASSVFAGMLVGGLLGGALCDRVGRRPLLLSALAAGTATELLFSCVPPNAVLLSAVRFLVGVASGATEPPCYALAAELSPPCRRGVIVTLVASFWMIGNVYVAVMGMLVFQKWELSWRVYVAICAIPSAVGAFLVSCFVPESPRYLASGSLAATAEAAADAAASVANRIACMMLGHRPTSGQQAKGSLQRKECLLLQREEVIRHYLVACRHDAGEDGVRRSKDGVPQVPNTTRDGWCAILSDAIANSSKLYGPGLGVGITLPLQITWFSLCYGSYCLVIWINEIFVMVHLNDVYLNALLFALANLPGNVVSLAVVDWSGRMPMLIGSLVLSAASLVVFAFYAVEGGDTTNQAGSIEDVASASATLGVVLSACAFQAFETVAWNALDVMTGELFPTRVRSTGIGVCTATGRFGALAAQFASDAMVRHPAVLLLVASLSFVVAAITPLLMRGGEMSQKPLQDDVVVVTGAARARHRD